MTDANKDLEEELYRRASHRTVALDWNAYPSYTLTDLKKMVLTATDPTTRAKIEKEIAEREAGTSVQKQTPVVAWR